jgi:NADPH-dependent 2,4-dienoyl-CoA reductase/sulfur reductase-like enzyme
VAAGRHLAVEHWGDADAMGTVAGTVAAGRTATWSAPPGFWSQIGSHTLKYVAWGDGYDTARAVRHENGGLTVWYSSDGVAVGVLTNDADDDFERGSTLIADGAPPPE